jgi:hypothetical protein
MNSFPNFTLWIIFELWFSIRLFIFLILVISERLLVLRWFNFPTLGSSIVDLKETTAFDPEDFTSGSAGKIIHSFLNEKKIVDDDHSYSIKAPS